MCVICQAAKKRLMRREEVLEATRVNSAGFFGFTVKGGVRKTIRTLDDKEFMKFFDEEVGDDDPWLMHARIPSRGEKSLDNVHGWDEDGIIFCHNMTMSQLDDMMRRAKWEKTDSEFFFRKVFMPYYRGFGDEAYKDGKLHPDIENLVNHFVGTSNKVAFVMPDNRILRFGSWVGEADRRADDGSVGFFASNISYRVYERAWPEAKAGPGWDAGNKPHDFTCRDADDEGYEEYAGYGGWCYGGRGGYGGFGAGRKPSKTVATDREDYGAFLREKVGDAAIARIALLDLVAHGLVSYRNLMDDGETEPPGEMLETFMPDCFSERSYDAVVCGMEKIGEAKDEKEAAEAIGEFAGAYSREIAPRVLLAGVRAENGTTSSVVPTFLDEDYATSGVKSFEYDWLRFSRIALLETDFGAKSPESFVCAADVPYRGKDGKWKVAKVNPVDLLVDETSEPDVALKAVSRLLKAAQDCERGGDA